MTHWNALQSSWRRIADCCKGMLPQRHKEDSSCRDWSHVLLTSGKELDSLAQSTEGEFLSVGEKLGDFHGRAREISKMCKSVAHLMTGEEMESPMAGFREVITRMETLTMESNRRLGVLRHLVEILSELDLHLSGFHKIVRSLRVLCVTTRIESAGLGERDIGFNVLAGDVEKLAMEIEEKYTHILEQTVSLGLLLRQALIKVSDLEVRQSDQAASIIGKTMTSLDALMERHNTSSIGAKLLATRYDDISRSIGEIVASMQFHDITRQRIEHARDALRSIREENDESEHLRLASAVCELQIAQLRSAGNTLVSSVENITGNLRAIANIIQEMSHETEGMAGVQDESGRSFLSELEADLAAIASAFRSFSELDRELLQITGTASASLVNMSAFAGEIEGVGNKIKRIALNAIVKASHMGDEGRTLSVLAEAIHQLSAQTCTQTEAVGNTLRTMAAEAESLRAVDSEREDTVEDQAASMLEVLQSLFGSIENISHHILTLLAQMKDEGNALSRDIQEAVEHIGVHHRVDATIKDVISQLEEIVSASRSQGFSDVGDGAGKQIEALEASYTMQEERAVHLSMLASSTLSGSTDPELFDSPQTSGMESEDRESDRKSEPEEEDLGDNVELF